MKCLKHDRRIQPDVLYLLYQDLLDCDCENCMLLVESQLIEDDWKDVRHNCVTRYRERVSRKYTNDTPKCK